MCREIGVEVDFQGADDRLLAGHELYHRLGRSAAERQDACRALFHAALDEGFVDGLRATTQGGWARGDARLQATDCQALGRRVAPSPRGRPPKETPAQRQLGTL